MKQGEMMTMWKKGKGKTNIYIFIVPLVWEKTERKKNPQTKVFPLKKRKERLKSKTDFPFFKHL